MIEFWVDALCAQSFKKNLACHGKKRLKVYFLHESKYLDRFILSTDDVEIAQVAKSLVAKFHL